MSGLVRLIIKLIIYVVIVFPVVSGIVGVILGSGWFGGVVGFIAAAVLAYWLESTGKSNQILAKLFASAANSGKAGSAPTVNIEAAAANLFTAEPKAVETTMKCPNCGSQVMLKNGHGKCEACDSSF